MMLSYLKLDDKTYPCQKPTTCSRSNIFFHIKNWPLVISQSWRWEMCHEGVEVMKCLGLWLSPNLRWKILATFAM
jgi:hypothetical protein